MGGILKWMTSQKSPPLPPLDFAVSFFKCSYRSLFTLPFSVSSVFLFSICLFIQFVTASYLLFFFFYITPAAKSVTSSPPMTLMTSALRGMEFSISASVNCGMILPFFGMGVYHDNGTTSWCSFESSHQTHAPITNSRHWQPHIKPVVHRILDI